MPFILSQYQQQHIINHGTLLYPMHGTIIRIRTPNFKYL